MEEAAQRKSFTGSLEAQGTNRHGSWLNLRVKHNYGGKNTPRVGVPAKIEDKMHERLALRNRAEMSNRTPPPGFCEMGRVFTPSIFVGCSDTLLSSFPS